MSQSTSFTVVYRVANSTPMVLLLSKLNSFRVKRDSKLLLPTPESPISTTRYNNIYCIRNVFQIKSNSPLNK